MALCSRRRNHEVRRSSFITRPVPATQTLLLLITTTFFFLVSTGAFTSLLAPSRRRPTDGVGETATVILNRHRHSSFGGTRRRISHQPLHPHNHHQNHHHHLLFAKRNSIVTDKDETLTNDKNNVDDDYNQDGESEQEALDSIKIPLALLFLSQFILFVGVGAVIPAIPLYGQEIGLSQAANGFVISAPAVALLLGAKFAGNYADLARKPAMLIGMATIAVADLGTALSTTLPQLIVARLGLGAGRCLAEAGERGLLADLAGRVPALRGRALAGQQATVALGIAVGAPLGGVVIEEYGARASFLCVSVGAVAALLIYTLLPETVVGVAADGGGAGAGVGKDVARDDNGVSSRATKTQTATTEVLQERQEWTSLLADRRWRGLALCQCGASFGFAAKIASIPLLATSTLPGGAAGTGVLISAAGLSGLVGGPVGGWLTDQAGASLTATLSGIVSAAGLILIPVVLGSSILGLSDLNFAVPLVNTSVSGEGAAFAFLVILWSLGATAQGPALTALAQELAPKGSEATALALPRAAGDGCYIVAPFLLGAVADSSVTVTGAECAVAGSAILLGAIVLALSGKRQMATD